MFGIVANILIGLMKSVFGIFKSGSDTILTAPVKIRDSTGTTQTLLDPTQTARQAADATFNTTTLDSSLDLEVTVIVNRHYAFRIVLFVEETTAADGLRLDFDGGTAAMDDFRVHGIVADTAGVRSLPQATAIATDITDTTTTGAAVAIFEGHMTVGSGGNFRVRVAKEADAAGANLTVRRGSYLVVTDIT